MWYFTSIAGSNGSLMVCCLVVVDHFICQLVDKFIEAFCNTSAAFACQETVNNNHGKDGQIELLGPIMCTKLLFNIKTILAQPVVLINASTVVAVQVGSLG